MAINLFAHVLRDELHGGSDAPAATAASDWRRWVLRDLVVRRNGSSAWGLSTPAAPRATAPRLDPTNEPLWPDTQPCCHE